METSTVIEYHSRVAIMVAASLLSTLLLLALTISVTAKPVLEGKSPMRTKLPLTKRYNLANYNVMKRDRRRLNSLRRRAGNQDNLNSIINLPARYKYGVYVVDVGVGLTNCKWLQHLVANEEIPTGSFFTVSLILDSARWASNVRLLHARLKWFVTAGTFGLELIRVMSTCRQVQVMRQATTW